MSRRLFSGWTGRIIWIAGFVILISSREFVEKNVLWKITSTYIDLYSWVVFLLPFITGVYIFLLFWEGRGGKADAPLFLIVCLPALLFSVLSILISTLAIKDVPYELSWIISKLNTGNILPLLAGITLLPGLSGKRKKNKRRR